VVIPRTLPALGLDLLGERYRVETGGQDLDEAAIHELAAGASALVSDPTVPVGDALLDAAGAQLKVVSQFGVGYDNVDTEALARHGVRLCNTPDVLTDATAELAVALALAALRRVVESDRLLREGAWTGWDPEGFLGAQLSGSTVGLAGLGRIGRRAAEMFAAFGVELLYWSRSRQPEAERALGIESVAWEALLERSDVLSLHLPLSAETEHLVDAAALARMPAHAVLVNTARGGLVDSGALADALREGRLAAAGLDVYEDEPNVPEELTALSNTVLLPHVGSATRRTRDAMARRCAENVIAVLEGRDPPSEVSL
jgi:glyoxylate reductase